MSIPSTYKRVNYIETDGNQYVDTGISASQYSNTQLDYYYKGSFNSLPSSGITYMWGCLADSCRIGNGFVAAGHIGLYLGSTSDAYYYTTAPSTDSIFEFKCKNVCPESPSNVIATLDGTDISTKTAAYNSGSITTNATILLLAADISGTVKGMVSGKLYAFSISTSDGTELRNFVPCYRVEDGVVGLYDTVSGAFYENAGSGSFTKGADVADEDELYLIEASTLISWADIIRAKTGSTDKKTTAQLLEATEQLGDGSSSEETVTYPVADAPETFAQKACLARAAQMRDIQYTLKADMDFTNASYVEGETIVGLPYSSVRQTDRFIGFNVSIYTFMTAINNPRSVLYKYTAEDNKAENGSIASVFYGTNCSTYVSYAHDWNYHSATNTIADLPYIVEIDPSEMKLCDLPVTKYAAHAVIITGIARNEDGSIATVEITESWPPYIKSTTMSYDDFIANYIEDQTQQYHVYRDTRLYECNYKPSPFVQVFDDESTTDFIYSNLCTDRGDKVSISVGEEIVLNVLIDTGYESIKLLKDGELYGEYTVSDGTIVNGDVTLSDLPVGLYTASLYDTDGIGLDNASTFFEVCSTTVVQNGTTFTFAGDGTPMRVVYKNSGGYTRGVFDLTDDDIARGCRTITGYTGEVPAQVCVPFKTTYGFIVARCEYNDTVMPDSDLPSTYQAVEYIESDGASYIDTGVVASDHPNGINYEWTGKINGFTTGATTNYMWGCLNSSKRSGNVGFVNQGSTSVPVPTMQLYLGSTSTVKYSQQISDLFDRSSTTFNVFATSADPTTATATYDGAAWSASTSSYTACDMPSETIYFMWCRGVGTSSKPVVAQHRAFKMTAADGAEIRNFIPCYRVSDGVIGLYDTVGDQFYTNSGTGSFTKGADV